MIEWMKANGDLVENWAFGILAWMSLAGLLGALAVLGLTALRVHLRMVRRSIALEDAQDRRRRLDETEELLRKP